ncbi:unnamed protein product, partial [Mesorhabditis belari]|uniref:NADH dehydrogenase [ubiquinone] 1 alpha subcomplex subunit 2 n=1 Tax=Mesorhabditis belari TaxID=2138241 RepID=A0AAF3FSY9_9BILA
MASIKLAGTALRELRIHLCQKSAASQGVRNFIEKEYVSLKKANPEFPILIREASGIVPRVFARYEHGVERAVSLEDASAEKVSATLRDLAAKAN